MAYDSAATRERLLDAAFREFAARGLAGARVDRIATAARANKQAVYAYFGSKDGLFDAVLADRFGELSETVPFTPDDVPGYAGALVDALAATPELLRLARWRSLERAEPTPGEIEVHLLRARQLRAALDLPDDRTASALFEIIVGICSAWAASPVHDSADRDLVVASVAAIVAADLGGPRLSPAVRGRSRSRRGSPTPGGA
ncbi:TetR/AcrR family transcriptional regulator [Umezawaea sp. NPDC059074]|uniref:TetR/AcrR family transcriptional regulator n=1 Tax=Umezawaea sp. NPDC059074 TaxID=3346716 RepID=UPI003696B63F